MRICFLDFESRSECDLPAHGVDRYAHDPSTDILCLAWAIDDGPVELWANPAYAPQRGGDLFPDIDADLFVASNSRFDRLIYEQIAVSRYGGRPIPRSAWMDAAAVMRSLNLPSGLAEYCAVLGTEHQKDPRGSELIKLLSIGPWNPAHTDSPELAHMLAYCARDVEAMRAAWNAVGGNLDTLTAYDFLVNENINDRGVGIDVDFAQAAARSCATQADEADQALGERWFEIIPATTRKPERIKRLTARHHAWKKDILSGFLDSSPGLWKAFPVGEPSCDEKARQKLRQALSEGSVRDQVPADTLENLELFLNALDLAGGTAGRKYEKICALERGGYLMGAYIFAGASQTGRYSSRGAQLQNLKRTVHEDFESVRVDVCEGEGGRSVAELATCIRPTFRASDDHIFTWVDYGQIEARVLPWLAGAEHILDVFRAGVDIYVATAQKILGKEEISREERQNFGKLPVLALGFGGGRGALVNVARNLGVKLTEYQAQEIVDSYRAANPWLTTFWAEVESAFQLAAENPWKEYPAGRFISYMGDERGNVACYIPHGRTLHYAEVLHERVPGWDGELRWQYRFRGVVGRNPVRKKVWAGSLVENVVQAVANSVLRQALRNTKLDVVMHSHDEIVAEVPEAQADEAEAQLSADMLNIPWADGLPLKVEGACGFRYAK